ncbi:MAG: hypothetical protein JETT_0441 [Candidatus Jettenia ecosi]|uniref:Uncharacterized protein n=1 Tax=Candidatus Jettenia ecosi TaxID=2494326 RepID=A0A533QF68_9BACT|nr:MAG: hypothetical protein JETT_0441 [Candidatus Jettenia ecosi]
MNCFFRFERLKQLERFIKRLNLYFNVKENHAVIQLDGESMGG